MDKMRKTRDESFNLKSVQMHSGCVAAYNIIPITLAHCGELGIGVIAS